MQRVNKISLEISHSRQKSFQIVSGNGGYGQEGATSVWHRPVTGSCTMPVPVARYLASQWKESRLTKSNHYRPTRSD